MTYLNWLHLSDWHQRGHDFDRTVIRDCLVRDILDRSTIARRLADIHFVLFSGDVAYSGRKEEYERAQTELFDPIMRAVGLPTERLFLAPGNHDLDRTIVREMLPPDLQRTLFDQREIQHWLTDERRRGRALEPFKDYATFVSTYTGQPSPDFASFRTFEIERWKIGFLGLNSAWMSGRNKDPSGDVDDYGRLVIGEPQIHDALTGLETCHLRIVVLHHPFEWLARGDRNRVEERLMGAAHLILRGHEHTPNLSVVTGPSGNCVIVPAGAAYDRRIADDPRYTASYNFTSVNLGSGQAEIFFRTWDDRRTKWVTDVSLFGSSRYRLPGFPQRASGRKRRASPRSSDLSPGRPKNGTRIPPVSPDTAAIRTSVLTGLPDPAFGFSWSTSGDRLACGADDGRVRWWDLLSTEQADSLPIAALIPTRSVAHETPSSADDRNSGSVPTVTAIAISPNDDACILGTATGEIWLANTNNAQVRPIEVPPPAEASNPFSVPIRSLVWLPYLSHVIAIRGDPEIDQDNAVIINPNINLAPAKIFSAQFSGFALTKDGKHFAALSSSKDSIRIGRADRSVGSLYSAILGERQTGVTEYGLSSKSIAKCCEWVNNGKHLAVGHRDGIVTIIEATSGRHVIDLEGHTDQIFGLSDGSRLGVFASSSGDGTVRIWDSNRWSVREVIPVGDTKQRRFFHTPSFHPNLPILAVSFENRGVAIWRINESIIKQTLAEAGPHYYANAKVVLIGDTGVGKSGLGLVLSGQPFVPTESTHGRRVWIFDRNETEGTRGERESREVLLWDMAGQPGYRLVHQLYLNEVAVALVVFDSRSETDPFAGVRYWDRALRQAAQTQTGGPNPTKFLVAARVDRGSIAASRARIEATVRELGFARYFETSASEGRNISELKTAIHAAVDWSTLPRVSSNTLFEAIKQFLISEKESGRVLSRSDDLFRSFVEWKGLDVRTSVTREAFDHCIDRVANRDLIRRLKFGGFILLQPEYLDAYAAAMVEAAKSEPDGLGFISEEAAMTGQFIMPSKERLPDPEQERLLLIATVEELLQHEIALKEVADGVTDLVFPAQFTRERPDAPDVEGKSVVFIFDGPVTTVYATLAVRLCHTKILRKLEMWKNAATFQSSSSGHCGLLVREITEGRGEFTLFYSSDVAEITRTQFEGYVYAHLLRRALADTIVRRRILVCPTCQEVITDRQAQARRERGYSWIACPVCGTTVELTEPLTVPDELTRNAVSRMDRIADASRDENAAATVIRGKRQSKDYDVFLSYASRDLEKVEGIGNDLLRHGILPWLDRWEIPPGAAWQTVLEDQIKNIKAAAVFVGPSGIGPWQNLEQQAFLMQFIKKKRPLIPVILPGGKQTRAVPEFLKLLHWVDFRKAEPDPLAMLIWGVTGERPLFMA